ncbi:MAG: UDP-glucose/GDP-mannose dehydrogenase family protein [Chitinivibrionia bacterium]|nr:UDP-glucose/GDP-mannose dehydrogenase family protein [Chitinivibrionia bacterium]
MKISMIGTGYVGLVSGACLADFGNNVFCIDIDRKRIDALTKGEIPIYEPGIEHVVERNVRSGRLHFMTDLEEAVTKSDVVFIAVGTPPRPDGSTDLTQAFNAAEQLASCLNGYKVIVQKSTVPVGTTRKMAERIREKAGSGAQFDIVSNPEFLREGSAIEDFLRPNRVVIGVESERAEAVMKKIYRPLYLLETPVVITTLETAELIKYASNAFLATKISFINEIAAICDLVGARVDDVAKGMGLDQRIGAKFLHAGLGYGGSCLPKDVTSLIHVAASNKYDPKIIRAAHEVNRSMVGRAVEKVRAEIDPVAGKRIGVLGLSFKPNTDDIREAPAIALIETLLAMNAKVKVFDPVAMDNFRQLGHTVEYCTNAYDAAEDCHALMLLTEWNEFRELDFERLKRLMAEPVLIDCRNVYKPNIVEEHGFRYRSFGRGSA